MTKIRSMEHSDLPAAFRLSEQAGWNQTPEDWRRFLKLQPGGCFVAAMGTRAVGTATTCVFQRVAWIGMLLVDQEHRGHGIGTALLKHAMDHLSQQGVRSVRLDATPLGEPLYKKLGFVAQYKLTRFAGVTVQTSSTSSLRRLNSEDTEKLLPLDRTVVGYDRRRVLHALIQSAGLAACCCEDSGKLKGYVLTRPGRLATYLGPCAASPDCGRSLLAGAMSHMSGNRLMIDIPQENVAAVQLVESAGLVPDRDLLRMCLGDLVTERVDQLWASGGPEKG